MSRYGLPLSYEYISEAISLCSFSLPRDEHGLTVCEHWVPRSIEDGTIPDTYSLLPSKFRFLSQVLRHPYQQSWVLDVEQNVSPYLFRSWRCQILRFRSQVDTTPLDIDYYKLHRRQGHRREKASFVSLMSAPASATRCNTKWYRDIHQLGRVFENSGGRRTGAGEPQTSDVPEHLTNEDIRFDAAQNKLGWLHCCGWKRKVRVIDLQDPNPGADYEDIFNIVEGDVGIHNAKVLDSVAEEGEIPGDGERASM